MCWTEGLPEPRNGIFQINRPDTVYNSISYLGIVKMNHCTIVLDHVDFLNAGDVVDCKAKIKLGFIDGNEYIWD